MNAVLIDTNILVYGYDRGEPARQKQAIRVLDRLNAAGSGRLSVQSLAEFFSAVTRGPSPKLTILEAIQQTDQLAQAWPVLDLTPMIVVEAMRGVRDHQLAYWDAQIWASARLNQIGVVFSEDLLNGAVLEGVRFVNPFADAFDLDFWT